MARSFRPADDTAAALAEAAAALAAGRLIIIPTDTVYGLAADAFNARAVAAVYEAKGRDETKPLVVMAAGMEEALELVDPCSYLRLLKLAPAWPGPLTVVARKASDPRLDAVTGGSEGIGVRIPEDAFTRRLLRETGPLAVTSVNASGAAPACDTADIPAELLERVDVVIEAAACGSGVPSSVLDIRPATPLLLRRGELGAERLRELLGEPVEEPPAGGAR